MPYQKITATVAPADVTAIQAAIATIQGKLPFLISLTARPFFERMGFGVIREQDVELRGVLFRNYAMQKIVGGGGK